MSKWWKCDLQVATPAWQFKMPAGGDFDLSKEDERRRFAADYMQELKKQGIEVIAIADHNTGEWIDVMVEAGRQTGIVVFPGCEVTTGSGADGIHIIVIGDTTKTSRDFDLLLAGALGFAEPSHPRFREVGGKREPGSSGRTLEQILDSLPDDYLVIAPHALSENGIASGKTAKGDIRWRALHHPRLVAIDPGDCANPSTESFGDRLKRRALADFPRLKELAFVATSDAYSLDKLGSRYSWIRMEAPTLEGLRQAFLDREARVLCDWDARLNGYPDRDPNRVRHGWVKEVHLQNVLGGTTASLRIGLHPALNVVIGGRGSGKSTLVTAIRQLYAGYGTLPQSIREEAERFASDAFQGSTLEAIHLVPNSQEEQHVAWSGSDGMERRGRLAQGVPTTFRLRVVSQKELFSRVAYDPKDAFAASRSFLAFVDEGLGLLGTSAGLPGEWRRRLEDAASRWTVVAREYQQLRSDLAQLPSVRSAIAELESQVAAFDSESARARRLANERRAVERDAVSSWVDALRATIRRAREAAVAGVLSPTAADVASSEVRERAERIGAIAQKLVDAVLVASDAAETELNAWLEADENSEWRSAVRAALEDDAKFVEELAKMGTRPEAYRELRQSLAKQVSLERSLATKEGERQAALDAMLNCWMAMIEILDERRKARQELLANVGEQSGRLRFSIAEYRDVNKWVAAVRDLLNLRADGFLEDVPSLGRWLWHAPSGPVRDTRWRLWRDALIAGDLSGLASGEGASLRPQWQRRLETLDEALRLRLATLVPEDSVEMRFLRDGGDPDRDVDWQDITQGSPGQRTAAMLAFVLHHGSEPLVLDQPEDDLDTEWLSHLVVKELRASRWRRQLIVITHNANIPVNGDAERVIVLENRSGALRVRETPTPGGASTQHVGAIEVKAVR